MFKSLLFTLGILPMTALAFQVGAWVGGPGQYPQPTQENVQAFQDLQGTHIDLISYFALFDVNDWNATEEFANVAKDNGSTLVVTWMANQGRQRLRRRNLAQAAPRSKRRLVRLGRRQGWRRKHRRKRRRSIPSYRKNLQGRRRNERQMGMDDQCIERRKGFDAYWQLPRRRIRGLHLHRRLQLGQVPELV